MDELQHLRDTLGGVRPLSKFLGFSENYVGQILNGHRPISRQFAMRVHERTSGKVEASALLFPRSRKKKKL